MHGCKFTICYKSIVGQHVEDHNKQMEYGPATNLQRMISLCKIQTNVVLPNNQ